MQTVGRYTGNIITITVEQMRTVDYLMENKYGINMFQMMENAGRSLALLARKYFLDEKISNKKIAVLAGKGGNGGGALVAARRLKSWGADVQIFLSNAESELKTITKVQLGILQKIAVPILPAHALNKDHRFDMILDGIYGYALQGSPDATAAYMIDWANDQQCPVISLDTPSGIELETGRINTHTIIADATLTIALPKKALLCKDCMKYTGDLFLADISVPPKLYEELHLKNSIPDYFSTGDIVQLCSIN